MTTRHVTSLTNREIVKDKDLGSIQTGNGRHPPDLVGGISIKRIVINPGAMRTPHWHANANELTYCVSGTVPGICSRNLQQVLQLHRQRRRDVPHRLRLAAPHREHRGGAAEFILAFRSERPEDFVSAAAFGAMTDAVLGNTYDLPAAGFAKCGATPPAASSPPVSVSG